MEIDKLIETLKNIRAAHGNVHVVIKTGGDYAELEDARIANIEELFDINAPYDDSTHVNECAILEADR